MQRRIQKIKNTIAKLNSIFLIAIAILIPSLVQAAVPSQFIAKQYTEALGRAPDPGGWQGYTNYFNVNGCSQSTLGNIASVFFGSAEYMNKGYSAQEQVLTLYRAILSREPDPSGFNGDVSLLENGGTAAQVALGMTASTEFTGLISSICTGKAYRQDWDLTWPMDIDNVGIWTNVDLQNCVTNNLVCNVPAGKIVEMFATVTIPAGHTLQTIGAPGRTMYARQARIVRWSAFSGHLLLASPGATVQDIWVNGSGNYFGPTGNGPVYANIEFETAPNTIGTIQNVRSDFPYMRTNFETQTPTQLPLGTVNIISNLTVGYASYHTTAEAAAANAPISYQTYAPWADGISHHAGQGLIQGNDIVDPTDAGIVIFGFLTPATGQAPQSSSASENNIVHAGSGAYGSAGLDTTGCGAGRCPFAGSGITNNTILAGQQQRIDILLFNGTSPWNWGGASCATYCGTGGQITNNTTIQGDPLQTITVLQGIVQDDMVSGSSVNNTLNVARVAYGECYNSPPYTPVNYVCIAQYYAPYF